MRRCTTCGIEQPLEEFARKDPRKGTRSTRCKACQREYTRRWYVSNAERVKQAARARRRTTVPPGRAIVLQAKDAPCADCGQLLAPEAMDFDHVRGMKVREISRMEKCADLDALHEEIAKCDVVCANCHRTRTALRVRHAR